MIARKIKELVNQLADKKSIDRLQTEIAKTKINTGKILSELNLHQKKENILKNIHKAEFQVFSQWGDDGIINFLVNYLDIPLKKICRVWS